MRKNDESARFPPRKIDRACEKIREYDRWPADGMSLAGEKMERLPGKYLATEANLSFHVGVYLPVYLQAKLFSHLTDAPLEIGVGKFVCSKQRCPWRVVGKDVADNRVPSWLLFECDEEPS